MLLSASTFIEIASNNKKTLLARRILMKKNLELLLSYLIIVLSFALPQAIHGIEDFTATVNNVLNRFSRMVSSDSDLTEGCQQKEKGHKEFRENLLERLPEEIRFDILKRVAIDNYFSGNTGSLELVCQYWKRIIDKDAIAINSTGSLRLICQDWWSIIDKNAIAIKESIRNAIYQRFLNGVLIYRPQKGSDVGRIDLRISELVNPLDGTFDLSQCGNAGQHLIISTGYRKQQEVENVGKNEIWISPRFFIEENLKTTANHFQEIFSNWNDSVPIGIFWTHGGWNKLTWYDYLTTEKMDNLSKRNLYESWKCSSYTQSLTYQTFRPQHTQAYEEYKKFTFVF